MGIHRFWVLDQFRPQALHQHFGAQGGNFGPPSLGFSFTEPPTYDCYREHYSCSLYQLTGWDPFLYPVSLKVYMFLWLQTQGIAIRAMQTHSGLSKRDSSPPILAKPAHNKRVVSAPRNSNLDLWNVGNSNRGHVCHSPQHASSPVYVFNL